MSSAEFPLHRPWMNAGLSATERAALLLEEMTLEEKADLFVITDGWHLHAGRPRKFPYGQHGRPLKL